MSKPKIAVFGASGFVGRHVVERLIADGFQVRAIARRQIRSFEGSALEAFPLDVAEARVERIAAAVRGCSGVINLVGIKREQGVQTFEALHVRFVARLIEAMRTAGVERLIHLSVLASRPDDRSAYHDSKWRAEGLIAESRLDYTILRPGVIYGAGDDLLGHLTKMIHASPVFSIVGDGSRQQQPVDVTDVARVVAACLDSEREVVRRIDVVGPAPLPLREIVRWVAVAMDRPVRIWSTPVALMRFGVWGLNRVMANPLSTPAQLQMLVDGMTADAAPVAALLGAEPEPFTVERIRPLVACCDQRLPFTLRLDRRAQSAESSGPGLLVLLCLIGIVVMNAAFLLPTQDVWTRVIGGIALLGAVSLPSVWRDRRELLRIDAFSLVIGISSGLVLYAVARGLTSIEAIAAQTREVAAWRGDHGVGFILPTLLIAVVSEEFFWRGLITRWMAERMPSALAALVGTAVFAAAHIGSGGWLLPFAGAGIVLVWNLLFVATGRLTAPLVSHLVFDLLAMLIAPLG